MKQTALAFALVMATAVAPAATTYDVELRLEKFDYGTSYGTGTVDRPTPPAAVADAAHEHLGATKGVRYAPAPVTFGGAEYWFASVDADTTGWLPRRDGDALLWKGALLRMNEGGSVELVEGGLFTSGMQIDIPITQELGSLEATGRLSASCDGWGGEGPSIYYRHQWNALPSGKVDLADGRELMIRVRPADSKGALGISYMLETESGSSGTESTAAKTDYNVTIEGVEIKTPVIADDLSSIQISVSIPDSKSGDAMAIGAALPAVAAFDLFDHKRITTDDLRKLAKKNGGLLMLFADPNDPTARMQGMAPTGRNMADSFETLATAVRESGGKDAPAFVVVARSIPAGTLFSEVVPVDARTRIVSDYADPSRLMVRTPTPYGGYFQTPDDQSGSMSNIYRLAGQSSALIAYNKRGEVVFTRRSVAKEWTRHLNDALQALDAQ